MFLSAFTADPEEQRFSKAVIHLRSLVFGPLSDDHVIALALLHELGELYQQAFSTDQVLQGSALRRTQEEALSAHLRALELPCSVTDLEPKQLGTLVRNWEMQYSNLPHPFDRTMQAFVSYAKTHLGTAQQRVPVQS